MGFVEAAVQAALRLLHKKRQVMTDQAKLLVQLTFPDIRQILFVIDKGLILRIIQQRLLRVHVEQKNTARL
ncbi:hypothetical protein D3C76_1448820 [compost metagenome]